MRIVREFNDHYLIGQYKIYKSDGCVYNTDPANYPMIDGSEDDIPHFIFDLRDYLLGATEIKISTKRKKHE